MTRALSCPAEAEVEQRGETEAQNKEHAHSPPCVRYGAGEGQHDLLLRGSRNDAAPGSREAVGLRPPLPAPTPVGRERRHASFHDLFRVTQRRVPFMAIREQHRYGTLPAHRRTAGPAQPGPPRNTRAPSKPRTGCTGTEG